MIFKIANENVPQIQELIYETKNGLNEVPVVRAGILFCVSESECVRVCVRSNNRALIQQDQQC